MISDGGWELTNPTAEGSCWGSHPTNIPQNSGSTSKVHHNGCETCCSRSPTTATLLQPPRGHRVMRKNLLMMIRRCCLTCATPEL